MSTFTEQIRERRALEPRTFSHRSVAFKPVPTLAVESWKKRSWHFPWSCLTRFEHDGSTVPEVLRLFFGEQEVVVEGTRLALLLPDISNFLLEAIRELPPGFDALVKEGEPLIRQLTVRTPSDRTAPTTDRP
jgi:hypothetical protein